MFFQGRGGVRGSTTQQRAFSGALLAGIRVEHTDFRQHFTAPVLLQFVAPQKGKRVRKDKPLRDRGVLGQGGGHGRVGG